MISLRESFELEEWNAHRLPDPAGDERALGYKTVDCICGYREFLGRLLSGEQKREFRWMVFRLRLAYVESLAGFHAVRTFDHWSFLSCSVSRSLAASAVWGSKGSIEVVGMV